jgi:short-subunit dehydrogenase
MNRLSGKTALITGASSGIGETMARQLAALSCPLVLVARRTDRLEKLKQELEQKHGITVTTMSIDLSVPGSAQSLYDQCQAQDLKIDILINNAGFAKHGYMLDIPLPVHQEMIQLMVTTLTELTYLFGQDMRQRKDGYVMLVSSLLGFMPGPQFATYSAIKAYALNLADSLVREFKQDNVRITALCPGGTSTEFMDVAGQKIDGMRSLAMMSSESVARSGLKALAKGKGNVVPGMLYKLAVLGLRLVPRNIQAVFGELATK